MSRTDVHRPFWVLVRDPYVRTWFTDEHDHSRGPCDLSVFLTMRGDNAHRATRCARGVNATCPNLCGCNMCTGHFGHRYARRASRRAVRVETHRLRTIANSGERDDLDVRDVRRRADTWW